MEHKNDIIDVTSGQPYGDMSTCKVAVSPARLQRPNGAMFQEAALKNYCHIPIQSKALFSKALFQEVKSVQKHAARSDSD